MKTPDWSAGARGQSALLFLEFSRMLTLQGSSAAAGGLTGGPVASVGKSRRGSHTRPPPGQRGAGGRRGMFAKDGFDVSKVKRSRMS